MCQGHRCCNDDQVDKEADCTSHSSKNHSADLEEMLNRSSIGCFMSASYTATQDQNLFDLRKQAFAVGQMAST